MVNITPSNSHDPERAPSGIWHTLAKLMDSARTGLHALFSTRVPQDLQERGLTQELFTELHQKFYNMLRGYRSGAIRKIQRRMRREEIGTIAGFGESLMASGWHADDKRSEEILNTLIGEYGWENDKEICEFLQKQFLRQPPALG